MAKKKNFFGKRSRRINARPRRRRSGSSGSSLNIGRLAVGAFVYGAARVPISNAIAPFTQRIPLGPIADEVGLAALAYFAHKMVKNNMVRDVAKAALTIELASIGQQAMAGGLGSLGMQEKAAVPGALF